MRAEVALLAFHDENGDGEVDRALFGVPREGVGFSRDVRIRFSPPRWRDAAFATNGGEQRMSLSLRYFPGASPPTTR